RLAGTAQVDPHRSELGLRPGSGLLGGFERCPTLLLVGDSFDLQALSDSLQVRNAGALHGEWLLPRLSCPVVADHAVRALPQCLVREIGLPFDDGSPFFHVARSWKEGLLNLVRCCLCECAGCKREYGKTNRYNRFHFVPPISFARTSHRPDPRTAVLAIGCIISTMVRL